MTDQPTIEIELDQRGLLCPLPVIALAQTARELPEGGIVNVLADDPAAAYDIPAWCEMRGHTFLGAIATSDATSYRVQLNVAGSSSATSSSLR